MADEIDEVPQSNGGSSKLIVMLIILIILMFIGMAVGGFMLYSKISKSQDEDIGKNNNKKVQKTETTGEDIPTINIELNDLILNITTAKGREKLMKLSLTLKCAEETCQQIMDGILPELKDVVIEQTSTRSSEELLTIGGKQLFKDELLAKFNKVVNEETKSNPDIKKDIVKKLYFTTFVIK